MLDLRVSVTIVCPSAMKVLKLNNRNEYVPACSCFINLHLSLAVANISLVKQVMRCNNWSREFLCDHSVQPSRNEQLRSNQWSMGCCQNKSDQMAASFSFLSAMLFVFFYTSGVLWQILFSGWLLSTGKLSHALHESKHKAEKSMSHRPTSIITVHLSTVSSFIYLCHL